MAFLAQEKIDGDYGEHLLRLIARESSAHITAPLQKFLTDSQQTRDLRSPMKAVRSALVADIANFLNLSHGEIPGIVDNAATKIRDNIAQEWLFQSINAFRAERNYLNKMAVAAGPVRRMRGQEKITAILTTQARSFEMLTTSDRYGCPAGAAFGFILDWQETRPFLMELARTLGIAMHENPFPSPQMTYELANKLAVDGIVRRAISFGAEQIVAQQRGLWKLIAARHDEMLHLG